MWLCGSVLVGCTECVLCAVERLSTAALLARREATLEQRKAAIADLASSLVEAPEDKVRLCSTLISAHQEFVCVCVCVHTDLQCAATVGLLL